MDLKTCKKCELKGKEFPRSISEESINFGVCASCIGKMYHEKADELRALRKGGFKKQGKKGENRKSDAEIEDELINKIGMVECPRCATVKSPMAFPVCSLANYLLQAGYRYQCTECNSVGAKLTRARIREMKRALPGYVEPAPSNIGQGRVQYAIHHYLSKIPYPGWVDGREMADNLFRSKETSRRSNIIRALQNPYMTQIEGDGKGKWRLKVSPEKELAEIMAELMG